MRLSHDHNTAQGLCGYTETINKELYRYQPKTRLWH